MEDFVIHIDGVVVKPLLVVCNLGVLLDPIMYLQAAHNSVSKI